MPAKLLEKIENFARTDIKHLFRTTSYLNAAQTISSFAGFGFAIVLGWVATEQQIGEFRYLLAVTSMFAAFTFTGFGTAITQSVARNQLNILFRIFTTKLQYCVPITVIGLAISGYYYWAGNTTLAVGLLFASLFMPLLESFRLTQWQVLGEQKIHILAILHVATEALPYLLLIATTFFTTHPIALISVFFVSNLTIHGTIFSGVIRKLKKRAQSKTVQENEEFEQAKKYGIKMSLISMFPAAMLPLDQILVFQTIGAAELALYSYALAVPGKLRGFLRQSASVALPRLSKRNYEEIRSSLPRKLFFKFIVVSIVAVAYYFSAPFIFKLLFPNFVEAISLSQLAALTLYGSIAPDIDAALQAIKAEKTIRNLTLTTTIVRILCLTAGVTLGGLTGLLIGSLVFYLIQLSLYLFFFFSKEPK